MNTRPLNQRESANLASVNEQRCDNALLFLTATGLHKSILDATGPVRRLMDTANFHDYTNQRKGPEFKVQKRALLLHDDRIEETTVSLYRPKTKDGDPRLWISGLKLMAEPNNVCCVFIHEDSLCLVNLSQSRLNDLMASHSASPTVSLLVSIGQELLSVANELLGLLRAIAASGPLPATCTGSTAIGRAVEAALGIQINSRQDPDYKGIEIKSGRSTILGRENRATLFACVPDWSLSSAKSSGQILDLFGYWRDTVQKLYCTVSTRDWNSQGLRLAIDMDLAWLKEVCNSDTNADVCVWPLLKLHGRLTTKHRETFWIKAQSVQIRSREHFILESVTHTARPSADQFDRLLGDGAVTVDHLIKRRPSGAVHEKGPLFKVHRPRLQELFLGAPRMYRLTA